MRTAKQLSITLPIEIAEQVRERVTSGAYASEREAIQEGLRTLFARDKTIERWLREDVAVVYDKHKADPSQVIPVSEMRKNLREQFKILRENERKPSF